MTIAYIRVYKLYQQDSRETGTENHSHHCSWTAGYGELVCISAWRKHDILHLEAFLNCAGRKGKVLLIWFTLQGRKFPVSLRKPQGSWQRMLYFLGTNFFSGQNNEEICKVISALLFSSSFADRSSPSPQEKTQKKALQVSENLNHVLLPHYRWSHMLLTLDPSLECLKLARGFTWVSEVSQRHHNPCQSWMLKAYFQRLKEVTLSPGPPWGHVQTLPPLQITW